jgi:hypothetical protein
MSMRTLLKLRLSYIFWGLLVSYSLLAYFLPSVKFESAALTLFSVNSFLYGFYIAPILAGQKARIEELHRVVRSEANALFAMALSSKKYSEKLHDEILGMVKAYINDILKVKDIGGGEQSYEKMITYAVSYKGEDKESAQKFLDQLIQNQANRSNLAMQLGNKVFSNEWWIMLVLFSITLSFILLLSVGDNIFLKIVKALLCTGLTMLLAIVVKLSTLTHKKASKMWDPLKKLLDSDFYRLD